MVSWTDVLMPRSEHRIRTGISHNQQPVASVFPYHWWLLGHVYVLMPRSEHRIRTGISHNHYPVASVFPYHRWLLGQAFSCHEVNIESELKHQLRAGKQSLLGKSTGIFNLRKHRFTLSTPLKDGY